MSHVLTIVGLSGSGKTHLIKLLYDKEILPNTDNWHCLDDFNPSDDYYWTKFRELVKRGKHVIIATSHVYAFSSNEDRLKYIQLINKHFKAAVHDHVYDTLAFTFKHKFIFYKNELQQCLRNLEEKNNQYMEDMKEQLATNSVFPPSINMGQLKFEARVYNTKISVYEKTTWINEGYVLELPVWKPID